QARRCAEEALCRMALLHFYRRHAPAQADPARARAPHAALERRARVPALRIPYRLRKSPPVTRGPYANLTRGTRSPAAWSGSASSLGGRHARSSLCMRLSASNGAFTFTSLSKYTYTSRPSPSQLRTRRAHAASARLE